ncbi:MAG TPA: hypothetical protein VFP97_06090 [Chitinophagaceae bacterium]|nr:hypothetical protein [Chitinophagaceae bacterium]
MFSTKECEKLLMGERSKPLPLPTLKLSDPPGAVRPDGKVNLPLPGSHACRIVTSKLIKQQSPIIPIHIGMMLLNRSIGKLSITWQSKAVLRPGSW